MFPFGGDPDRGGANLGDGHTMRCGYIPDWTLGGAQVDRENLPHENVGRAFLGGDCPVKMAHKGNPRRTRIGDQHAARRTPHAGNAQLLDAKPGQGLTSTSCSTNSPMVPSIASWQSLVSTSDGYVTLDQAGMSEKSYCL